MFVDKTQLLLTFTCQLLWTIVVSVFKKAFLSFKDTIAVPYMFDYQHIQLIETIPYFVHAQHLIKSKLLCLQRRFNLYYLVKRLEGI